MGREVRYVKENWEHPKKENGNYVPLLGGSFKKNALEWEEEAAQWKNGLRKNYSDNTWIPIDDQLAFSYEDWNGITPEEDWYMPDWDDCEKTHLQMYETTSEGTPISPVFSNAVDLARWLVDNNASAFGGMEATYEQWLSTINRGFAPSGIISSNGFKSGVEGLYDANENSN